MLRLAYEGTDFAGWQRQKGRPTVQQTLEEAAEKALGHKVRVVGAGRTDQGVHALGQVATFRTDSSIPAERLPFAINPHLPDSVRVTSSSAVSPDFHPCLSAVGKHYRYTAWCGRIPPVLYRNFVAAVPWDLHWESMVEAARFMIGRRDWRAFRNRAKGQTERETVKNVFQLVLRRSGAWFSADVLGSGFLYKQVRSMIGTLFEVGRGKIPPAGVREILDSGDRRLAGPTAPAKGLCLVRVFYDRILSDWHETTELPLGPLQWETAIVGSLPPGEESPEKGSRKNPRKFAEKRPEKTQESPP